MEEFNTTSIDMGNRWKQILSSEYYEIEKFSFTDAYTDFLGNILEKPEGDHFKVTIFRWSFHTGEVVNW